LPAAPQQPCSRPNLRPPSPAPPPASLQDGLSLLTRQLAAPGAPFGLLASANVLAMSYHNAAVEHEKLGRLREALVSFTR
jgi:hypothetical protein